MGNKNIKIIEYILKLKVTDFLNITTIIHIFEKTYEIHFTTKQGKFKFSTLNLYKQEYKEYANQYRREKINSILKL